MSQSLKEIVHHIELPPDQLQDQDPEIREIFVEEVQEILEFLDDAIPKWIKTPSDKDLLTEIRRSFHTLKGSGRMAGAVQSAELAWAIEDMLNRVMSGSIKLHQQLQKLVYSVARLYEVLVKDFIKAQAHQIDLRPWILTANLLRDQQEIMTALSYTIDYYQTHDIPEQETIIDDTSHLEQQDNVDVSSSDRANVKETVILDPTLEIFLEESNEHLQTISEFLHLDHAANIDEFNQLLRALHTIRGSSGMVEQNAIFSASSQVEQIFKGFDIETLQQNEKTQQLLLNYYNYISASLTVLADNNKEKLELLDTQFTQNLQNYQAQQSPNTEASTQGVVAQLLELNINDLLDAEFTFVEEIQKNASNYLQHLIEQADILIVHTTNAQTANLNILANEYQRCYQALFETPQAQYSIEILETVQGLHQYLIDVFDGLASGQNVTITHLIEEEFEQVLGQIAQVSTDNKADVNKVIVEENTHLNVNLKTATPVETGQNQHIEFDPDLLAIFLEESEELINQMDLDFSLWEKDLQNNQVLQHLFRYLHTLKGGANMVQATQLGLLAHELETIYDRILKGVLKPSSNAVQMIRYVQDNIAIRLQRLRDENIDLDASAMIQQLQAVILHGAELTTVTNLNQASDLENSVRQSGTQESKLQSEIIDAVTSEAAWQPVNHHVSIDKLVTESKIIQHQSEIRPAIVQTDHHDIEEKNASLEFDSELLAIFVDESTELLESLDEKWLELQKQSINDELLNAITRDLHTLKGGANMVQAIQLGQKVHALESVYEAIIRHKLTLSDELMLQLRTAQDRLLTHVQQLTYQQIDSDSADFVAQMHKILTQNQTPVLAVTPIVSTQVNDDVVSVNEINPLLEHARATGDDQHVAMVESYLDEANEQLTEGEALFAKWANQRNNRNLLLVLQRNYHTLKGNSRLVGEELIANMAYQLEYVFEQFALHQFTATRYDELIRQTQAWLRQAIEHGLYEGAESLQLRLTAMSFEALLVDDLEQNATDHVNFDHYNEIKTVQGDGSLPPAMYADYTSNQPKQHSQELIRISADLVEKMIDLSGESAINRSRIELDLGQMAFTLTEMELAIQRLADQLRRMEGELETQILTKHESDALRYEDFDPLEMDQYSALNQLSKSLAESASDLIDFKTTLADKIRDTENLLLQQSRIQNELQQNLMGTRLVPFSRLIPRLQRLVRQISTQLNRPAELLIDNTEGELDRNILERLVSPLEHMLRNAIDHGIEDQETRLQLGKPAIGSIQLSIASEGHDILVMFSDDGRGIDTAAVKEKAIRNGLISPSIQVSDDDLMQYVFHSGLTTAKQVTQISGRGVGLDVVQNEIKSLGGNVSVSSKNGQGTVFTIRVPTTVSVSDALMVKVADQQFALPLAQIERIVRVSPVALMEYYDGDREEFTLDHQTYRLRYMGEFIQGKHQPELTNMGSSVPVIIYNSAGRSIALQVDQLVGSRAQIVMKPIGDQLSSVGYLGGATILADGRVCLILDGASISRRVLTTSRIHQQSQPVQPYEVRQASRKTIMVVDDSVTVRKVTSRLLERQGFEVITAKDGVDAVEKLTQVTPDLMLLDIEMPRMDGFEVLNFIRHDSKHKQLPIVMITSRTGEKHRERAFGLGVNRYMGKPFQEADLIENIQALLEETQVH
ncbi:response regulator [Acinetobacter qingfengensis]|uniref:Chemotaxis protein CheA n=1 Tax=Acinetobacter qingfengensis TaxID=1262585 RepID=A0A1E7RD65_9GAMM|nr:Hpt domain-containing protein [Acinetobacter qingfengensis]KAA8734437.1 response regulator [Acinetobacter qingfengensis]OEY97349.1 hypothetical protein BJI46_10205 [Acinetobacter qingfengensis]